ncbi:hypothetical protein CQ019_11290 [Arthrobacter sp. MYb229]|uniref:DUF6297 family protein n=1 Tax=unclassified Arthrobacter TaxID=235627 RepID=UPI000CFDC9E2|nr:MULTISPECIES: DUF6297 family protein [unclassified Arthrobacter]PRA03043.1 hypothetical protein CQ019_11290 [Arthrobacter sp. MYb229]PRB49514.1 hypothetical protein CQ013_12770 [Arthrobacter sp. MYb216]
MSASKQADELGGYDPREMITRMRKRRDRSARFEAFSDAYIWVLLAVIALVYLFSVLSGVIFALQGGGIAALDLPSAVWNLQDLAIVLIPALLLCVFRGLLYLGPCGLSPDKASWWLPLPIKLSAVRQRALGSAIALGALANIFVGVLWFVCLFALSGGFTAEVLLLGIVAAAASGALLGALAALAQIGARQRAALRVCQTLWSLLLLGLSISWSLLLFGNRWLQGAYGRLGELVFEPSLWAVACSGLLVLAAAATWLAFSRIERLDANSMRQAGQVQNQLVGSMIQMDLGGVLPVPNAGRNARTRLAHSTLRRLPVVLQILVLRYLRGRHWNGPLRLVLTALALTLGVRGIANPLALTGFLVLALCLLTENLSQMNRPLASQPGLAQLLGLPRSRLVRPALGFTLGLAFGGLLICSALPAALGMIPSANLWPWCAGLLVAACGITAAMWGRATRGERDWESLILGSANELHTGALALKEFGHFLQALASGLPIFFLLLAPGSPVPWGVWALSTLCAYPGYLALRRAGEQQTATIS